MILFEKKYQTFDTVFHHQMKHLEVRQKYSAASHVWYITWAMGGWQFSEQQKKKISESGPVLPPFLLPVALLLDRCLIDSLSGL